MYHHFCLKFGTWLILIWAGSGYARFGLDKLRFEDKFMWAYTKCFKKETRENRITIIRTLYSHNQKTLVGND